VDKELLFARKQAVVSDTEEVPIGNVGVVVVRALTRAEVKACRDKGDNDIENHMIAAALVDPEMTPDEVAQWLDGAPAGDSVAVSEAVARLSGFDEGAQKSRLPRNGKRGRR
jgi:hypothetical protein